jgi:hypothetical protein
VDEFLERICRYHYYIIMLIKIITEVLEYVFNSYGKVPVEGKESGSIGMKPLHSKD